MAAGSIGHFERKTDLDLPSSGFCRTTGVGNWGRKWDKDGMGY
ncbi:hypothetical protein CCACVL1_06390 [Corchorus capsularis]|uniref:Uncharacterized protein n=1 Tax=Corchorus capsularis TaxID=210143 RepID=A0A1R3JFR9_COCAP|nr:hypothetical protein CCACVL1_06390 [Corchorus capsularis]